MPHKVYMFNIYSLIQECYYQTTLPPPLSLFERIAQGIILLVNCCRRGCKISNYVAEDCFSKYNNLEYAIILPLPLQFIFNKNVIEFEFYLNFFLIDYWLTN